MNNSLVKLIFGMIHKIKILTHQILLYQMYWNYLTIYTNHRKWQVRRHRICWPVLL